MDGDPGVGLEQTIKRQRPSELRPKSFIRPKLSGLEFFYLYCTKGRHMLKDTLSKFFKVDSLLGNLTGYVETRVELLKIEVKEDVAKGLAQAVSYLFIAFVFA